MRSEIASLWAGFWRLLRETEPEAGSYDVEWNGPYYISRPRQWHQRLRVEHVLVTGTPAGWSFSEHATVGAPTPA